MAGFQIRMTVEGLDPLLRRLDKLNRNVRNKVLRYAVRAGGNLYNRAARAACKRVQVGASVADHVKVYNRTGLLRRSLGVKITIRRSGNAVAVIGPRVGFKEQVGTVSRGRNKGQPIYEDPARIAHLVEFGHGGPHPAPPHPFMRPAWDGSKKAVEKTMTEAIAAGLIED